MNGSISRRHLVCSVLSATLTANKSLSAPGTEADITSMTLENVSAHIRRRSLSPVEVTRACLDRIERLNPKLNAFSLVTSERAMSQAATAEKDPDRQMAWSSPWHSRRDQGQYRRCRRGDERSAIGAPRSYSRRGLGSCASAKSIGCRHSRQAQPARDRIWNDVCNQLLRPCAQSLGCRLHLGWKLRRVRCRGFSRALLWGHSH